MCRGSPNIEMDEHTFMVNRERAVDYLNSLDKVDLIFISCRILLFNYFISENPRMLYLAIYYF
jgi:hypothetical protein